MVLLRPLVAGVVVLQALGVGAARGADDPGPGPASGRPTRPRMMVCGPNVLYMLLKMHGLPVTYAQVVRELGSDDKVTTMLELRDAAARLGLSTRVRRYSPEKLGRCAAPFVAHCRGGRPMGTELKVGHYMLVTRVDKERVQLVDGTTGETVRPRTPEFLAEWTGYVLEPSPTAESRARAAVLGCGIGYSAALGLVFYLSRRRSAVRARTVAVVLLLLGCWLAGGVAPVAASGPPKGPQDELAHWRAPENDGVNCLYLQLAALGHPVEYSRVREAISVESPVVTLVTLRSAARRCGTPMRIIPCNIDELRRMPKPVITYIEGVRAGGSFVVLRGIGDEKCDIITGGAACLEEMSIDKFRRHWAGFVLAPEPPDAGWANAVAGCLAVIAAYSGWRLWLGA